MTLNIKNNLKPETLAAVIMSLMIILATGAISYASRDNFFVSVGIITSVFGVVIAIALQKDYIKI